MARQFHPVVPHERSKSRLIYAILRTLLHYTRLHSASVKDSFLPRRVRSTAVLINAALSAPKMHLLEAGVFLQLAVLNFPTFSSSAINCQPVSQKNQ